MTKKKTTTESPFNRKTKAKAPEPKPKYSLGQKLYTIKYHKTKPEEIWEVKIVAVLAKKIGLSNNVGVRTGTETWFTYNALTPFGGFEIFHENVLYASFHQVANAFAEVFLIQRPS